MAHYNCHDARVNYYLNRISSVFSFLHLKHVFIKSPQVMRALYFRMEFLVNRFKKARPKCRRLDLDRCPVSALGCRLFSLL